MRIATSTSGRSMGGHGTGPCAITAYTPGRHIRFGFGGGGRSGFHAFEVMPAPGGATLLRHTLKARLPLRGIYRWLAQIRRLHDQVLEDLLDKVEGQLAHVAAPQVWSSRVIRLRRQRGMSLVKTGCRRSKRTHRQPVAEDVLRVRQATHGKLGRCAPRREILILRGPTERPRDEPRHAAVQALCCARSPYP